MLRLLIVTSGLFVSSFGVDVDFSFGKSCFSLGGDLELIAEYTGSGTVTAVQWYYSGQVGSNLIVLNSTCAIGGTPDLGYPDASRMVFTCPAINKFTLTLKGLLDDELKKSWGATFSLSSGSSPTVAQKLIEICPGTTSTTASAITTVNTTNTNTSNTEATTYPSPSKHSTTKSSTVRSPVTDESIIIGVSVGGVIIIVVIISIIICFCVRKKTEKKKKTHAKPEVNISADTVIDYVQKEQATETFKL